MGEGGPQILLVRKLERLAPGNLVECSCCLELPWNDRTDLEECLVLMSEYRVALELRP
jgi:hypothetical protein